MDCVRLDPDVPSCCSLPSRLPGRGMTFPWRRPRSGLPLGSVCRCPRCAGFLILLRQIPRRSNIGRQEIGTRFDKSFYGNCLTKFIIQSNPLRPRSPLLGAGRNLKCRQPRFAAGEPARHTEPT
jgi:hypothetical protein